MMRILLAFLAIAASTIAYLNYQFNQSLEQLLLSDYHAHEKRFDEVLVGYRINSKITFLNTVMQSDVLTILRQTVGADKDEIKRLHFQLYELLESKYRNLKDFANVRQLHFHLPDGRSFLRMHRPDKFGDPLFSVRYSVKESNQKKAYVEGFEEGRIFNGYRFVYPILDKGQHLGSVEVSVSVGAVIDSLKMVYSGANCFLLDTNVVGKKVFSDEKSNYQPSPFGDQFAIDTGIQNALCMEDNPYVGMLVKDNSVLEKMHLDQPISVVVGHFWDIGFNGTVAHFIPIHNVAGKPVAYFYSIDQNKELLGLYASLRYNLFLALVLLAVIFSVIIFFNRRDAWLQEQKVLLEKKLETAPSKLNSLCKKSSTLSEFYKLSLMSANTSVSPIKLITSYSRAVSV